MACTGSVIRKPSLKKPCPPQICSCYPSMPTSAANARLLKLALGTQVPRDFGLLPHQQGTLKTGPPDHGNQTRSRLT
jgi:hypothetical protein